VEKRSDVRSFEVIPVCVSERDDFVADRETRELDEIPTITTSDARVRGESEH
jgi:hypothetical protein